MSTSAATDYNTGALVCPYIASLGISAELNVESSTQELVTINNIDQFLYHDSAVLADAFDCSGWGIDKSHTVNEVLISGLVVSLDGSGSALKSIIADAIGGDDDDAANLNSNKLNNYLRGEFISAFEQAFPDYSQVAATPVDASGNTTDAIGAGGSAVDGTTTQQAGAGVDASGNGSAANPAAGSASKLGASTVVQTSTVSAYGFHLDVSGGAAAEAMVGALTASHLNSIFMQLPIDNLKDAAVTDSSGNNQVPTKLPLKDGDSITFVFDVEVAATSDANTSNAAINGTGNGTAAPSGNTASPSTAQQSISMDLGTRRVAVTITYSPVA
jgi:hypothetical protein